MLPLAVLTCACLGSVLCAPSLDPQLNQHWELWKDWHSKEYHEVRGGCFCLRPVERASSKSDCVCVCSCFQKEEGWRRMVWEKNLKKIELHNLEHSMGTHSYRLGMNHFGDMVRRRLSRVKRMVVPVTEADNDDARYFLFSPADSRGVPADHERLQAQNRAEVQGVRVYGAQLPGSSSCFGLEGARLRHTCQRPGKRLSSRL